MDVVKLMNHVTSLYQFLHYIYIFVLHIFLLTFITTQILSRIINISMENNINLKQSMVMLMNYCKVVVGWFGLPQFNIWSSM